MFARTPRFCSTRARSSRLCPPRSRARRKCWRAWATASVSRSIPPSVLRASPASTPLPARRATAWLRRHSSRASADSPRWWRTTARRRSASANTACSSASSAAAMAASYDATASGIWAARSRARASCSRSAAGRTGARGPACPGSRSGVTVTAASPGDSIVREVVDQRRNHPGVWKIVRGLVLEDDVKGAIRVHDLLREQRRHVRRIAVRVAHHQIRGLLELELRLEADGIHLPALFARKPFGPELNRSRDRHPPLEGARRDEEHVRPDRDAAACGPDRLQAQRAYGQRG